jgi:hypothetical protein
VQTSEVLSTYKSFNIIFCKKMNQQFHYKTISSGGQRKEELGAVVQWGQALLVGQRESAARMMFNEK